MENNASFLGIDSVLFSQTGSLRAQNSKRIHNKWKQLIKEGDVVIIEEMHFPGLCAGHKRNRPYRPAIENITTYVKSQPKKVEKNAKSGVA